MIEFCKTETGQNFFEHQVPQLIDAVNALTAAMSKAATPVHLHVTTAHQFLHDLYFGNYEPEVYKVTSKIQRLDRAVGRAQEALADTLSGDSLTKLADYELALSARNSVVAAHAHEFAVCPAVHLIETGLFPTPSGHAEG